MTVIERLRKGMIISIEEKHEFKKFLNFLENNAKIKWITGAKATDHREDIFEEYKNFALVVRTDSNSGPTLQYSSLEFYLEHTESFPYPITSYKKLFNAIRRF